MVRWVPLKRLRVIKGLMKVFIFYWEFILLESALCSVYAQPCAFRCMLSEYLSSILSYSMNLQCSQMLTLYREPIGILPGIPMRYESILGSTYFQPCAVRCMVIPLALSQLWSWTILKYESARSYVHAQPCAVRCIIWVSFHHSQSMNLDCSQVPMYPVTRILCHRKSSRNKKVWGPRRGGALVCRPIQ